MNIHKLGYCFLLISTSLLCFEKEKREQLAIACSYFISYKLAKDRLIRKKKDTILKKKKVILLSKSMLAETASGALVGVFNNCDQYGLDHKTVLKEAAISGSGELFAQNIDRGIVYIFDKKGIWKKNHVARIAIRTVVRTFFGMFARKFLYDERTYENNRFGIWNIPFRYEFFY